MNIDQVYWVLFHIKPDQKLCSMNLVGASLKEVIRVLRKCRARVSRNTGAGLMGLDEEWSNVSKIATEAGWQDSWYTIKKTKGSKTPKPAETQVTEVPSGGAWQPSVLAIMDGIASGAGGGGDGAPPVTLEYDARSMRHMIGKPNGEWAFIGERGESVTLFRRGQEWMIGVTHPETGTTINIALDMFMQRATFRSPARGSVSEVRGIRQQGTLRGLERPEPRLAMGRFGRSARSTLQNLDPQLRPRASRPAAELAAVLAAPSAGAAPDAETVPGFPAMEVDGESASEEPEPMPLGDRSRSPRRGGVAAQVTEPPQPAAPVATTTTPALDQDRACLSLIIGYALSSTPQESYTTQV